MEANKSAIKESSFKVYFNHRHYRPNDVLVSQGGTVIVKSKPKRSIKNKILNFITFGLVSIRYTYKVELPDNGKDLVTTISNHNSLVYSSNCTSNKYYKYE